MKDPKLFLALPTCHPERSIHAKGLCKECYFIKYRKTPQYQKYLKSGKPAEAQKRYKTSVHGSEKIRRYKQLPAVRDRSGAYLRRVKYGITDEQYDELLLSQDGRCAICYADDCKLCVDHCHASGNIRGLLCHPCNAGLGYFSDSISKVTNALRYISI